MKKFFIILTLVGLLLSCQKELQVSNAPPAYYKKATEATILGKRLNNPYSLENMQKALDNLSLLTKSSITTSVLQPTHYYVRFLPKSSDELDILFQDSTVIWYDYPLDYDIEYLGDYYHDPSIPEDQPTYQYASIDVKKWRSFSNLKIKYEVLSELFIPDENKDGDYVICNNLRNIGISENLTDDLVEEAMRITGNKNDNDDNGGAKWRPSGKITYYDDFLRKTIGLEGIKVKARRWFTTHTGFVNSNGDYTCSGFFKGPANYSFDFTRYDFHIKGEGTRVSYNGPKMKGKWDYHFSRQISESEYFGATIFRAAYHYYHKDIGGLCRPPQNSFWRTKMRIKAFNKANTEIDGNFNSARRFLGLGSQIKIYNPSNPTYEIYATTIHELAHAAHWRMIVKAPNTNRYRDFHYAEDKMIESWANGVEWFLTKMIYKEGYLGSGNFYLADYTNIVIDLVDSIEDDYKNYGLPYTRGDKVEGYTMPQLEQALKGCDTWNKWRDNIKRLYNNKTEQYVDELFAAW